MKKYSNDEPVFSNEIDILETSDRGHADVINSPIKQVYENTQFLRKENFVKTANVMSQFGLSQWKSYEVSSPGWYRIATRTSTNAWSNLLFYLGRGFTYGLPEGYLLSVIGGQTRVNWQQLNYMMQTQYITKVRLVKSEDSSNEMYIDFYYSYSQPNNILFQSAINSGFVPLDSAIAVSETVDSGYTSFEIRLGTENEIMLSKNIADYTMSGDVLFEGDVQTNDLSLNTEISSYDYLIVEANSRLGGSDYINYTYVIGLDDNGDGETSVSELYVDEGSEDMYTHSYIFYAENDCLKVRNKNNSSNNMCRLDMSSGECSFSNELPYITKVVGVSL